jgi:hypothetical protein
MSPLLAIESFIILTVYTVCLFKAMTQREPPSYDNEESCSRDVRKELDRIIATSRQSLLDLENLRTSLEINLEKLDELREIVILQ